MNESPEVTSGHVYVSHWPNPDLVMFENMAYKALVRTFLCFWLLITLHILDHLSIAIVIITFIVIITNANLIIRGNTTKLFSIHLFFKGRKCFLHLDI